MFKLSNAELETKKAIFTVREIESQPILWKETLAIYENHQKEIDAFLDNIHKKHGQVKVIFTGAGTSQHVGDVLYPYFLAKEDSRFRFESTATTDIVSNPREYLKDVPTILVSFARSGNSPESLEAVNLANQLVTNIYHLAITCAKEGKLAANLTDKENAFVFLTPDLSNDKGFAMTSSFTCMTLGALLVFDEKTNEEKTRLVNLISKLGQDIIDREDEVAKYISQDFDRVVYLGSGALKGLTREAQLKILELTAGKIATCYDSSMGFRHGPKSFVDGKTLVFSFISNDEYTKQYDLDIVNEIFSDEVTKDIVAICQNKVEGKFHQFSLDNDDEINDVYLALPYIIFAQIISVLASLKVDNLPDTPSANGTVNRVVQGVIIHGLK